MAWTTLWVFLLAGLISPMVTEQMFTVDYETTDGEDSEDDTEDEDAGEDEDTDGDYGEVFQDYFDDEMRVVDVDQDVAIEACVTNSDALVKKIDKAYNKCFKDFEDWSEFQKNNDGNDQDKDGLSDEYEADEACFYKRMGWVVNNMADKEAIKKDFENLNLNNVKDEFVSSIDACSSWNGKFVGRKKRDAEEDSWALNLARERREAAKNEGGKKKGRVGKNNGRRGNRRRPRNNNNKGSKKGGRGKKVGKNNKDTGKGRRQRNNNGKGKGNKGRRRNKTGKGKGKGNQGRRRNSTNNKNKNKKDKKDNGKKNKGNKDKKENRKGKKVDLTRMEKQTIKKLLPETVYNQLWCYELSVEKALENCVTEKILP